MSCESCSLGLIGYLAVIKNNDVLLEWLRNHGALPKEKKCEKCGNLCKIDSKMSYRCRRKSSVSRGHKRIKSQCNFSVSARKGTFFAASRLSIHKICTFVLFWAVLRPPRTAFIMEELDMGSETVTNWSSYCREVCISWCHKMKQQIGGVGVTVEIDEAKIGKRKNNKEIENSEQWVLGGFERASKKMFVCAVENRSQETLLTVIKEYILPGTTIISNGRKAYDCLQNEGFIHLNVNHNVNFMDPETGAHTQNIERCWRDVRENIPKFGRKKKHYEGYLCEFLWKRSLPKTKDRIHAFFKMASEVYNPNSSD